MLGVMPLSPSRKSSNPAQQYQRRPAVVAALTQKELHADNRRPSAPMQHVRLTSRAGSGNWEYARVTIHRPTRQVRIAAGNLQPSASSARRARFVAGLTANKEDRYMRTYQQIPPPGRSLLRHLCRLRTWLVLLPLGMAFSSAHAQSACTIGYTIANQWQGGFQAALTIGNTGTTAISNWSLTWSFANGQTVTQLWNGTETQSGANVTVTNAPFNGGIPPGGSVTGIGCTGSWNNATNAVPAAFALNGVACNGASSGGGTPPGGPPGGGSPPPSAQQIAWVSPASGVPGSSMTIMPGVGASFGGSQGTSTVLFGTTRATVTTWTVNSVTVTVPSVPAGQVNVTAVVNGVTSNAVPFTVTSATPSPVVFTGNSTWFSALGSPYGGCGVPQANLDSQNFIALNVQDDPGNYPLQLSRPISSAFANDIGLWNSRHNNNQKEHKKKKTNNENTNKDNQNMAFCRGGAGWVNDEFT